MTPCDYNTYPIVGYKIFVTSSLDTHAFPWHSPPPPCLTSSQSNPGLSCPLTESAATLGACPTGVNCVPASLCPMVIIIITRPKPPYGRRGLTGGIVGPGYTSLISININEIANPFHHSVCQIPHCTMHYALHCEFALFSPLTCADRHTHYSTVSLYIDHFYQTHSIVITTVCWIARTITGCI